MTSGTEAIIIIGLIRNNLTDLFLARHFRCPLSSHPRSANHPKRLRNRSFCQFIIKFHWKGIFWTLSAFANFKSSLSQTLRTVIDFYVLLNLWKSFCKSFTFQYTSFLRPKAMGALCEWNQNKSDWAVLQREEASPDLCNSLYIDKVHSVRAFLHIIWHFYDFMLVRSLSCWIRISLESPQTTDESCSFE